MKVSSLAAIHYGVLSKTKDNWHPKYRIRRVNDLSDYLVCDVSQYNIQQPKKFRAICLFLWKYVELRGDKQEFILLSTLEEIDYLTSLHDLARTIILKSSYRYCEIGEG